MKPLEKLVLAGLFLASLQAGYQVYKKAYEYVKEFKDQKYLARLRREGL